MKNRNFVKISIFLTKKYLTIIFVVHDSSTFSFNFYVTKKNVFSKKKTIFLKKTIYLKKPPDFYLTIERSKKIGDSTENDLFKKV